MLKKIFIKNGIIMISTIDNMDINYNIINDMDHDKINSIKKYYEKKGCAYDNKS
tara:strand:- start:544 stop:705 length:162 start_codon:yes stop_codon:yes gene_type:complete